MRRKSERTAGKKTKSPEKKLEKVKRTRTRRRKQSTSSDNESADETSPVKVVESVSEVEKKPPTTPTKEPSPEEAQDQVWRVKTSEGSGEIQKLKICLTRPPSTPERADRSPRSKRKHSRATSSSDTPSNEGDDKKKSKHRSKRSTRESKDNPDSQEEHDAGTDSHHSKDKSDNEISQSSDKVSDAVPDDTPMSTTNEEAKPTDNVDQSHDSASKEEPSQKEKTQTQDTKQSKTSDADTTVASPKVETTVVSSETETTVVSTEPETNDDNASKSDDKPSADEGKDIAEDKSEVLELHAEDNKCDTSDTEVNKSNKQSSDQETKLKDQDQDEKTSKDEVSKTEDKSEKTSKGKQCHSNEGNKSSGDTHVVEKAEKQHKEVVESSESKNNAGEPGEKNRKELERSDSTHSQQEENAPNGSAAPIVISRKRRWGSRATKIQTQKSITISTDILKDIIPDVKPVEFDEVIEDKKSKREVIEKIERPVLPKIVIDNTESIEINKKASEERDRENVKPRDSHLTSNRKISIVKENNSIIARPPSPPRHKQSCILFITNLVRPFTLPQLKNLLQRTGRIVEDGFWIDRIKSKCYVKYETEDQAVETRHALHGVTWPVSNPKTLQVDFSTVEAFDKAKLNEDTDNAQASTIPGTVEDWLREQDMKRERGEIVNDKPYERKAVMREWDVGKNDKDKEKDKLRRPDERLLEKRRHRTPERSPEPARKFKKKEEEAPAKLLDDLFRKTKTTPCIYWLPLSAETIAVKEEQRRAHMAEHERRLQELRRTHRRH